MGCCKKRNQKLGGESKWEIVLTRSCERVGRVMQHAMRLRSRAELVTVTLVLANSRVQLAMRLRSCAELMTVAPALANVLYLYIPCK